MINDVIEATKRVAKQKILFKRFSFWDIFVFEMITLLIVSVVSVIFRINWKYIYQMFFVTSDGKANAVGVTALISIVVLVFNIWDSRRRMTADLVSKSRIDWMKTVRQQIAIFVSRINRYLYLKYEVTNKGHKELLQEMSEVRTQVREAYYEIRLYIPNNESNAEILEKVADLYDEVEKYQGNLEYASNIGLKSEILISHSSEYFKKEWDRAKRGK